MTCLRTQCMVQLQLPHNHEPDHVWAAMEGDTSAALGAQSAACRVCD
jgi:hypothetical protein